MATQHDTGGGEAVPVDLPDPQVKILRGTLTTCLEGVSEDLKSGKPMPNPERARREAEPGPLAYGFAFLASLLIHRQTSGAIEPGATGWTRAMRSRVPAKKAVRIMVELNDGRKVAGVVTDFSSAPEQNREIVLGAPIVATIGRSDETVLVGADFLALREDQITLLSGRYVNPD